MPCRYASVFLFIIILLMYSCERDFEPGIKDSIDPSAPKTQGNGLNANEVSGYLVLTDASKITGIPPDSPDGQLKMNVRDTLYSVKAYPIGIRILVKHALGEDVSGFFIFIPGSSFYYDVPESEEEDHFIASDGDTTSIIYIDASPPDDADYPYTFEITIIPHDPDGSPLDEFKRWVSVEDPEITTCPVTATHPCPGTPPPDCGAPPQWVWQYTYRMYNDQILNLWAPGLKSRLNSKGYGCCSDDGNSYSPGQHPACDANATGEGSLTWIELDVYDYLQWHLDWLYLWDNGTVDHVTSGELKQYYPWLTDFCKKLVGYEYSNPGAINQGTHDYTPGADHINFDFPNWSGSMKPQSGDLIYTCHMLIIISGGEDIWTHAYKKYDGTFELFPKYWD